MNRTKKIIIPIPTANVNIGVTHFIMGFVGLSDNTIKLFDSKVIKKL
jgi:hypothetical protein